MRRLQFTSDGSGQILRIFELEAISQAHSIGTQFEAFDEVFSQAGLHASSIAAPVISEMCRVDNENVVFPPTYRVTLMRDRSTIV